VGSSRGGWDVSITWASCCLFACLLPCFSPVVVVRLKGERGRDGSRGAISFSSAHSGDGGIRSLDGWYALVMYTVCGCECGGIYRGLLVFGSGSCSVREGGGRRGVRRPLIHSLPADALRFFPLTFICPWEVRVSRHVSVGVGDCAIILRVVSKEGGVGFMQVRVIIRVCAVM
jgi:hypothetical protein